MRNAAFALILFLTLSSCLATQAAVQGVNATTARLEVAILDLQRAEADPDVTQGEVDELKGELAGIAGELKAAVGKLPEAAAADMEQLKRAAGGILGLGGAGDATGIGMLLTAAGWWLRDRRKKLGGDPLQNPNIRTPPVNPGGWTSPSWRDPYVQPQTTKEAHPPQTS